MLFLVKCFFRDCKIPREIVRLGVFTDCKFSGVVHTNVLYLRESAM